MFRMMVGFGILSCEDQKFGITSGKLSIVVELILIESNEIFSINSFCEGPPCIPHYGTSVWKTLWSIPAPPNVAGRKALLGKNPTRYELMKRRVLVHPSTLCPFCSKELETISHLLCHCSFTWLFF
ncbi:hypothetical protein V6N12_020333 [Hibiscus sabdariffa]|uniref:Reverse transcriptase zinc-binding domain-containing protein n=1 Tax=Hibiscus sabdariffa TaxID=183260 RepID=A0ABR2B1S7_9ROSI